MTVENLYKAIGNMDERHLKDLIESETKICSQSVKSSFSGERTIVMDVVKQKKSRVKVIAVVLAAVIAAGVTAAAFFGTKKDKKEYKEKKIENYFRLDEDYNIVPEIKEVMKTSVSDDGIYMNVLIAKEAENYAAVYDSEADMFRNIDISEYKGDIYKMYSSDLHLWIAFYDDNENSSLLVRFDTETLESDGVIKLNGDEQISQMKENEDGSCMIDIFKVDEYNIIGWSFCTFDSSMNETERITINEDSFPEDCTLNTCIRNWETGDYYMYFNVPEDKSSLYKYSIDGTEMYHIDDARADINFPTSASVFLTRSGNPVVTGKEWSYGIPYVKFFYQFDELDAQTGEVCRRFETDDIKNNIYFGWYDWDYNDDYDFIWFYDLEERDEEKGKVYGFDCETGSVELIMDCSDYGSIYKDLTHISSGSGPLMISGPAPNGSETGSYIVKTDFSGNTVSKQMLPYNYDVIKFKHSADNRTYMILTEHEIANRENIQTDQWYICEVDSSCRLISKTKLDIDNAKMPVVNDFCVNENSVSVLIDNFQYASNGRPSNEILIFDREGNKTETVRPETSNISCVFESDGILYALCSSQEKTFTGRVDVEKHSITEISRLDLNTNLINNISEGTGEYNLFLSFDDGIYGYRLSDNSLVEYVNWMDSDLEISQIKDFYVIDENRTGLSYFSNADNKAELRYNIFSRVDDETLKNIQNRSLINIAFINEPDIVIRDFFREYNITSEEYRVHIDDYSKYSDSDNIFRLSSHFDSELLQGNIPDIIFADSKFDWLRYSNKGIFENIDNLSVSDPDFDRSQYFENIFDAYRYNDNQYVLPLRFGIKCMHAKKSFAGDKTGFTIDELLELKETRNLFSSEMRYQLLDSFILSNITEYVDFETSKCDFNNPEFVKLLKLIKEAGIPDPNDEKVQDEWFDLIRGVALDKAVFSVMGRNGFENTSMYNQVFIGEESAYIGIPSPSESKLLVSSQDIAAISSHSKNKTAAWNIIKNILSDEQFNSYDLPVNKSAFDSLAELEINNSKGGIYSLPYGKEIRYKKLDRTTVDNIRSAAESISKAALYDSGIARIIDEEFVSFTDGNQSAEDTARNIQHKVSLYLKEIK